MDRSKFVGAIAASISEKGNLMGKTKAKPKTLRSQTNPASEEQLSVRRQRIAEAAYYKAERRGFAPGFEERDWLAAESEMDAELRTR